MFNFIFLKFNANYFWIIFFNCIPFGGPLLLCPFTVLPYKIGMYYFPYSHFFRKLLVRYWKNSASVQQNLTPEEMK